MEETDLSHALVHFRNSNICSMIPIRNIFEFKNSKPLNANDFDRNKVYYGRECGMHKFEAMQIFTLGTRDDIANYQKDSGRKRIKMFKFNDSDISIPENSQNDNISASGASSNDSFEEVSDVEGLEIDADNEDEDENNVSNENEDEKENDEEVDGQNIDEEEVVREGKIAEPRIQRARKRLFPQSNATFEEQITKINKIKEMEAKRQEEEMSRKRKIKDLQSNKQKERLEKKMVLLEKQNLNFHQNRQALYPVMNANFDDYDNASLIREPNNSMERYRLGETSTGVSASQVDDNLFQAMSTPIQEDSPGTNIVGRTISSMRSDLSGEHSDAAEQSRNVRRQLIPESTEEASRIIKKRRKKEDYYINAYDVDEENENGETERMIAEREKPHLAEWEEQINNKPVTMIHLGYNVSIKKSRWQKVKDSAKTPNLFVTALARALWGDRGLQLRCLQYQKGMKKARPNDPERKLCSPAKIKAIKYTFLDYYSKNPTSIKRNETPIKLVGKITTWISTYISRTITAEQERQATNSPETNERNRTSENEEN